MVQSPSWAANWFAASQEIPRISRNPKVHYRTHKRPPPFSILGQPNSVHIPTSHLLEIHPNISLCMLRDISPRNNPPPSGDPIVWVVYLRIVLSPEQAPHMWMFLNINVLQGGVVSTSPNHQAGGPSLSEAVPLSATWGRAMPWWQGPTTWIRETLRRIILGSLLTPLEVSLHPASLVLPSVRI